MLLPIGDDDLGRLRPPVLVYLIIAINFAVFLLLQQVGSEGGEEFTYGYLVIPYEITHNIDLVEPQRVAGVGVIPEAAAPSPIWLTIFTSMLVHCGWAYVFVNRLV